MASALEAVGAPGATVDLTGEANALRSRSLLACSGCASHQYCQGSNCKNCPLPSGCMAGSQQCSSASNSVCTQCLAGYYVNGNGGCSACSTLSGCALCNYNPSAGAVCIGCNTGYYLTGSGTCSPCTYPCLTCSSATTCTSCALTYFVNPSTNQCSSCTALTGCSTCESAGCSSCNSGYYLDAGTKSCKSCSTINGCTSCDNAGCLTCSSGYYPANGGCVTCPNGCSACTGQNSCTQCAAGWYLNGKACTACSQFGGTENPCTLCTATGCTNCYNGDAPQSGTCPNAEPPVSCPTYDADEGNNLCKTCDGDGCSYCSITGVQEGGNCPDTLSEICDGNALEALCDDRKRRSLLAGGDRSLSGGTDFYSDGDCTVYCGGIAPPNYYVSCPDGLEAVGGWCDCPYGATESEGVIIDFSGTPVFSCVCLEYTEPNYFQAFCGAPYYEGGPGGGGEPSADCTITPDAPSGQAVVWSISTQDNDGIADLTATITGVPAGAVVKCAVSSNWEMSSFVSLAGATNFFEGLDTNQTVVMNGTAGGNGDLSLDLTFRAFGSGTVEIELACMVVPDSGAGTCAGDPIVVPGTVDRTCFPADATVKRVDPSTGNVAPARMDQLRIGDTVECLKPTYDPLNFVGYTGYTLSTCEVFYYLNKISAPMNLEYRFMTYAKLDGGNGTFRVSPLHNVFIPTTASGLSTSPPIGGYKQAKDVVVGDLLAPQDAATGLFYTTPILDIQNKLAAGAFTPMVVDGFLIVDGVAVWTASGSVTPSRPHNQARLYWQNTPVWQAYRAGASCLDSICVKQGDLLNSLVDGRSSWFEEHEAVRAAAKEQNRTYLDLPRFIKDTYEHDVANHVFTRAEFLDYYDTYFVVP